MSGEKLRIEDLAHFDEVLSEKLNSDASFETLWNASAPARHASICILQYRADNDLSIKDFAKIAQIPEEEVRELETGE